MEEENVWDQGRWALVKTIKFDFMTKYIFEHIKETGSYANKNTLELGSGLGRLSYMIMKEFKNKVTLLDSSTKALQFTRQLFEEESKDYYEIVDSDLFEYSPDEKYDMVFSSGLIEHFQEQERFEIIKRHIELAKESCVIIHPSDTLYAKYFNVFPLSIKLYGFQKSFSEKELNEYLDAIPEVKSYTHKRYHLCYTIPILHNFGALNRFVDSTRFGQIFGGQTITHVKL